MAVRKRNGSLFIVALFYLCSPCVLSKSQNDFDTYNADECQRVRRPWHKLSSDERQLYVDGILALRENGQGSLDHDEFVNIASVHDDPYAKLTHKTSSYLFWHGYVLWELESRIRNLGGRYKCFAMPYWDFTLEVGREDHPLLFETGELGSGGDPNNYYTVNDYSWPHSISEFWVPHDCYAEGDVYPLCSLKRQLRGDFDMPDAETIGMALINSPGFRDTVYYCEVSGRAFGLVDAIPVYKGKYPQGFEPVWWLFHSFAQYNQALWTDCNDYDLIDVDDLDAYPHAFEPYCESRECNEDEYPLDWREWGLDAPLHFGSSLVDRDWSYAHDNAVTIRKLYMLPRWNIVYELDTDEQDFYVASGMKDYCEGRLNEDWFVWDKSVDEASEDTEDSLVDAAVVERNDNVREEAELVDVSDLRLLSVDSAPPTLVLVTIVLLSIVGLTGCYKWVLVHKYEHEYDSYGSVGVVM